MAQIPSAAPPQVMPLVGKTQVVTPNPDAINRSGQAIAGGVQDLANTALREQDRQTQEDQALARVKASNLLLDRETQLRTITTDLAEKARIGELKHDQLQPAYEAAASKLEAVMPQGLDPAEMEGFGLSLKQMQLKGIDQVSRVAGIARIGEAQSDLAARMDLLGKDAGMPGSDPDAIARRMDSEDIDVTGRMAFGLEWDSKKQGFRDMVYDTNATQRINAARDDMGMLNQLEHDLTAEDGYYASRLDANRRTIALNSVMNNKTRLENRAIAMEARLEAGAQRAMYQADQQIASGIPAPDGFWDGISSKVSGTSFAGDFNDMVKSESEVQSVLRLPPDQQMSYIQQKQADLQQNGGTARDVATMNRMSGAVQSNIKLMIEQPLQYAQARMGQDFVPLDPSSFVGGDPAALNEQLQLRANTIQGMQNKFGNRVQARPLLPQEAKAVESVLQEMPAKQKVQVFGMLQNAFNDDKMFIGAMQQIGQGSPMLALTGMLAAKQRSLTTNTHWFKPNEVVTSGDVAQTMALGESILTNQKDGAKFPMPASADFDAELSGHLGKVFANQPQSYMLAAQAVRSYYAGASAEAGDTSGVLDSNRIFRSVKATVGEIVDYNGVQTLAPWGMSESDFTDRSQQLVESAFQAQGLSVDDRTMQALSLRQSKDGVYYVMQGQQYKYGADGKPMMINFNEETK